MSRRYWYLYVSGPDNDPASYVLGSSSAPNSCTPGVTVCAIYGLPGTIDPTLPNSTELTGTFQSYIAQAKIIKGPFPIFPQKAYVYVRA